MRAHNLVLLSPAPPPQSLLCRTTLAFKHILHSELLQLVPSHLQRTPIAWIYQVIYGLVVYLHKRNKHLEPLIRCSPLLNLPEEIPDGSRDYSLDLFLLVSLDGVGFARPGLSVGKYGGVIALNNSLDHGCCL